MIDIVEMSYVSGNTVGYNLCGNTVGDKDQRLCDRYSRDEICKW